MDPSAHLAFGLASVTEPGDETASAALLADAEARGQALLVAMGGGLHQGHHPLVGRFDVLPRRPDAPPQLPPFMARLVAAPGVHVGDTSPEGAAIALVQRFLVAAERLGAQEAQPEGL